MFKFEHLTLCGSSLRPNRVDLGASPGFGQRGGGCDLQGAELQLSYSDLQEEEILRLRLHVEGDTFFLGFGRASRVCIVFTKLVRVSSSSRSHSVTMLEFTHATKWFL